MPTLQTDWVHQGQSWFERSLKTIRKQTFRIRIYMYVTNTSPRKLEGEGINQMILSENVIPSEALRDSERLRTPRQLEMETLERNTNISRIKT